MHYSRLTQRIQGEGAEVWKIHDHAVARQAAGDDIIILSIGDPDFDTPASIVETAVDSLRGGDTHYVNAQGKQPLRERIARRHRHTTGQEVDAGNVHMTSGAQNAIYALAQCVLDEGDEILMPEPAYVAYEAALESTGATIVRVPLRADNDFDLDVEDVAHAITSRTRAMLINSPHNPTGRMLSLEQAQRLAELCCRHDLWLFADEVYALLSFRGGHISLCSLPGMAERTATMGSLSKSHAMTGWRLGWIVAPEPLIQHIYNLSLCSVFGTPGFLQDAAMTALDRADDIAAGMRDAYHARLAKLLDGLSEQTDLHIVRPDAGMFVLMDVRRTGLDTYEFANRLLAEQGVSVLPADAFGASAAGFVRLSLTVESTALAEACRRIRAFVQSLSKAAG